MLNNSQIQQIQATVPILREHGVALTTHFYQRMLTSNPALREVFNLGHQRSGAQAKALANAVLAYAEHIEQPEFLKTALDMIIHKHISLNIQPDQYAIVGENLLVSISDILQVPMDSELIQAWALAYQQLANLLIHGEQVRYDQQRHQAGGWIGWREFIIQKKIKESSEISSFYLAPVDGQPLPNYHAGQYVSLRTFVPELGILQPRQYTLSDCPRNEYYRISVKHEKTKGELAAGWVSTTLHHHRMVGDIVELSMPSGDFYLKNPDHPVVLISAGVGITPMIAILNQLATIGIPQPVCFIHACRNSEAHAMRDHLQELTIQYSNLKYWVAYSRPQTHDSLGRDYHYHGRINTDQLIQFTLLPNADYYLCGNIEFIRAQYQSLLALGISTKHIFTEIFSTGGFSDL